MKEEQKKEKTYTIGEVSQLLNIKEHTIRFWEKEFPFLNPHKNMKGRRVYGLDDVKLLQKIKKLLYNDGYTIKGALKELDRDHLAIEIQTSNLPLQEEIAQQKQQVVKNKNLDSLALKQIPGEDLYKKISHEIIYRVYQEIDDLISLWKDFPDERH